MKNEDKLLIKYYRISLEDRDKEESDSIVNQRNLIADYIAGHAEFYEMPNMELYDDGYTGTNFNRPGIKKFFELLRRNKVGCLIVKDFSRFTRDYIELGNYAEQIFPFMDVRFIAVNDHYDSAVDNSNANLEIPFKGILNDLYSKDISMKVKAAKWQMTKKGKICSGSHPFGYKKAKCGGSSPFEIDEEAAAVVQFIFQWAMDGKTNIEIARTLNERGYDTPGVYKRRKGDFGYGLKENEVSVWDSTKVLGILRDERYTGTLIVGRYQSCGIGSGKIKKRPEDLWVRIEGGMPAIVSKEDFAWVQKSRPIEKRGKYKKGHHLLYRKVKCGCCGHYLYFKPSDSGEQYNSFFCKQTHLLTNSTCFRGYIKEKEILDALQSVIKQHVKMVAEIKKDAGRKKGELDLQSQQQRLKIMEKEVELKQAVKAQEYMAYRERRLTKEEFLERKNELQKEISEREKEVQTLRERIKQLEASESEFAEAFGSFTTVECLDREMIERLVDTVWVYDVGRIKIDLKYCDSVP